VPKQSSRIGTGLALPLPTTCACFGTAIRLPKQRNVGEERRADRLNAIGTRWRERAVLTFSCARAVQDAKSAARFCAAVALSAMAMVVICSAAYADGVAAGGCIGNRETLNCTARWGEAGNPYIRIVPAPVDQEERDRAAEREHKWEQRCKPAVAQDRYGVARYRYSAPGCDFGILN
jgi:hypothetical protein